MSISSGLCASHRSAKIQAITISAIQPAASQNRAPGRRLRPTGLTAMVSMPRSSVAMADPRIEHGIEHVDDEIHEHETRGDEQHDALQDDEIAGIERADQ